MTDAQKARQAANDASKEFRALALKEGSTSEDIEKATKELNDLETRAEALERVEPVVEVVKTEPTEDSETRERRELRSKARVSDFVVAALKGQPVTGASGEYADAEGLSGRMPLSLLERESEERAVTPGPDSGTVTTTRPTVPYAFSRTDSAALGITFPMVAPGEAHFPALETAPPAGPKAKDAAAAQTAAAFTLVKRDPKRITGQFLIRLEACGRPKRADSEAHGFSSLRWNSSGLSASRKLSSFAGRPAASSLTSTKSRVLVTSTSR